MLEYWSGSAGCHQIIPMRSPGMLDRYRTVMMQSIVDERHWEVGMFR